MGDLLFLRRKELEELGDDVAGEFLEERGAIVLEPSNPSYEPLRFAGAARAQLRILGKLVGVLRKI